MDYLTRCKGNVDICATGVILGILITLLLVFVYMKWFAAESFEDPNDLDPATKALLAYHLQSDPIGMGANAFIKNGKEHLAAAPEAQLYK